MGLLNIAAFYTANYYLSVSTTFSRAAGMLIGLVAPEHAAANAYWQNVKPAIHACARHPGRRLSGCTTESKSSFL